MQLNHIAVNRLTGLELAAMRFDALAGVLKRVRADWPTDKALGEALGVSGTHVARVMTGKHSLSAENCLRLARLAKESPITVLQMADKDDVAELILDFVHPAVSSTALPITLGSPVKGRAHAVASSEAAARVRADRAASLADVQRIQDAANVILSAAQSILDSQAVAPEHAVARRRRDRGKTRRSAS